MDEKKHSYQKSMGEYYLSKPTNIIKKLSDTSDIASFCNLDDLSPRTPSLPKNIPEKNVKLGDPLYKAFGYPSKVYYKVISPFIEAYSQEGDVVLDPMAGSGSTALAALYTGRKAIVNDGSLLASFTSKNMVFPVETWKLEKAFLKLKRSIKERIDDLYIITCSHCGKKQPAHTIFHSDVYECPECGEGFPLLGNKSAKATYKCPSCGFEISTYKSSDKKHRIERRRPIKARYECKNCSCGKKKHTKKIDETVVHRWNDILESKEHLLETLWVPNDKIVTDRWYTRKGSWPGFKKGSKVVDLFTRRNLLALAILNNQIERKIENKDIKSLLKFVFISSLIRSSNRMYTTSVVKTYYQVPAVGKVQNVWQVFERKFNMFLKSRKKLREISVCQKVRNLPKWIRVINEDAKKLDLPKNSIDYVFLDPPRGSQIGYYELNLFYSCWLKSNPENFENEVIIPMETDDDEKYAKKWSKMMFPVFQKTIQLLKPGRFMTVMFHNLSNKIWNRLKCMLEDDLNLRYVGYMDLKRGTTFHTNRLSKTSQRVAFVTYQKRREKARITAKAKVSEVMHELPSQELEILKKEIKKRSGEPSPNLREVRDLVVRIVHEKELSCFPSNAQIKALISKL